MEFFVWLENSAFFSWVRESSSLLAYPAVSFLHTFGLGILVGISIAVSLRILGLGPGIPLSAMQRLFPIMWAGFVVNAISGTILMIQDASTKLINPLLYIKLVLIALSVVVLEFIKRKVFRNPSLDHGPVAMNGKILAAISIALWIGAITAGRLMGYIGPVSGLAGN